jgi:hypothetical protein
MRDIFFTVMSVFPVVDLDFKACFVFAWKGSECASQDPSGAVALSRVFPFRKTVLFLATPQ